MNPSLGETHVPNSQEEVCDLDIEFDDVSYGDEINLHGAKGLPPAPSAMHPSLAPVSVNATRLEPDSLPCPPSPGVTIRTVRASADVTMDDSPIHVRKRLLTKRIIHEDDSSSPQKKVSLNHKMDSREVLDDSVVLLSVPRKPVKLVRAAERPAISKASSRERARKKKLPGDQCPFFDMRAINSDDPDSETDPEEEEGDPETCAFHGPLPENSSS